MAEKAETARQAKRLDKAAKMAGVISLAKFSAQNPALSRRHFEDHFLKCADEGFKIFSWMKCADAKDQRGFIAGRFVIHVLGGDGFQPIVNHLVFAEQPARQFEIVE